MSVYIHSPDGLVVVRMVGHSFFLKPFNMSMQIFIVRHAKQKLEKENPPLSEIGIEQANSLAKDIFSKIRSENVTIWTSSAKRAFETAEIIRKTLFASQLIIEDKLWADNNHSYDFDWLKAKIQAFRGDVLIIVTHMEYVQEFPFEKLGMPENNAQYAEGILIEGGKCYNIKQK